MFRAYEEPAGQSIHCLAPIVSALAALLSAALVVVHARDLAAALLTVDGWTTLFTYWPRLLGATLLGVVLTPAVLGRLIKFPATPTLPCVYIVAAALGAASSALFFVRAGSLGASLWRAAWITAVHGGVFALVFRVVCSRGGAAEEG